MSHSTTFADSVTFSHSHAVHMAAKVATDLKRMQRFYGKPTDAEIAEFEAEIVVMLKGKFLIEISYGFLRDGKFIEPTLRYTAQDLAGRAANDDDPGRVLPGANIEGASFHSFLVWTAAWSSLPPDERASFEKQLPFVRTTGSKPEVNGTLVDDRIYSAGGWALNRKSVKRS
ncbi:hypothetical protein SAMN05519103_03230 [Rhizobiales bacterium GAS113]|nr:hypothetical protein SAMN05519103_03230 [Rhizobiales bacterium GAS113]